MDEYDKKFAEMQKYIPFLEAMIERLQNVKDRSPECQLQRLQGLYGVLKNKKRKLKIETLHRCEDVLQKLHNKVEKGNSPGLQISSKKPDALSSSSSEDACMRQRKKSTKPQKVIEIVLDSADETPASPSPNISPTTNPQQSPIIIPTERNEDSKPASPDPAETVATKSPIVIPTERQNISELLRDESDEPEFSEWDMLEESEKQSVNKSNWESHIPSFPDVANAAKTVSSNLPRKVNEGRPIPAIITRNVQTAPVLSTPRRLSSTLEQGRIAGLDTELQSPISRSDSPVNVPDVRLKSPDSDIYFSDSNVTPTAAQKEAHYQKSALKSCLKKPAPLLVSPPPVSSEPPLSMEDIAQLLSDDGVADDAGDKKLENDGLKKSPREKSDAVSKKDAKLFPKDAVKLDTNSLVRKSVKVSPTMISTATEAERESEKRWEEIDKHIVKFPCRKPLPISEATTPITSKLVDTKVTASSPLCVPLSSFNVDKPGDHRTQPPSPMLKNEPRYADNYERHPRQHPRESQAQDSVKDRGSAPGKVCREEEIPTPHQTNPPTHHEILMKQDERNAPLYQRRPQAVIDNVTFNRQMPNNTNWSSTMSSTNVNEFCPPWGSPGFNGIPNPPVPQVPSSYSYPLSTHSDMWNTGQGINSMVMETHPNNEPPLRPPFPPPINIGHRPMSSTAVCSSEMSHAQRDELPSTNVPGPPTLLPMNAFPVGSKSRPYEAPFDRPTEFAHNRPSWDTPPSRLNDIPYREKESCGNMSIDGPPVSANPFVRSGTPCSWNRDRNRANDMYSNQNRGRDMYYERNRSEPRVNFNRDVRRPEWSQNAYPETNNRFSRDVRTVSERDPRMRAEHNIHCLNSSQSMSNVSATCSNPLKSSPVGPNQPKPNNSSSSSVRDPRLAKDKQNQPNTVKPKDPVTSDRDPRRRSSPILKKLKYKSKNHRSPETHKRESEVNSRQSDGRIPKEMMQQSPLESLYGVIDTKGGQGYISLQKFKIPKIKRPEKPKSSTTDTAVQETNEKETSVPAVTQNRSPSAKVDSKTVEKKNNTKDKGKVVASNEVTAEVSSSSDGNSLNENKTDKDPILDLKSVKTSVDLELSSILSADNMQESRVKIGEADSASNSGVEQSGKHSSDSSVTQELIEALIKKSLECGEGKKLFEERLLQKLGEALQAKKFKKIKKIFDSGSESSDSSDEKEILEQRKMQVRKKRRVIVSDSSDEESLADKLGLLNTTLNSEKQQEEREEVDEEKHVVGGKSTAISKADQDSVTGDSSGVNDTPQGESVNDELKKLEDESTDAKENENTKEVDAETAKEDPLNLEGDSRTDENKENVSKATKNKPKRRNSFEMLQENIRDMFICDDVITATGHRTCRITKESSTSQVGTSQSSTAATKRSERLSKHSDYVSESDESVSVSLKAKPSSSTRSSTEMAKCKSKKISKPRSKESVESSDTEEDRPLALRAESLGLGSDKRQRKVNEKTQKNQESEILRRSKRVLRKDVMKEPRVLIEKTDLTKLDSSRIMFDSSSDESFGIDVSELTAAVDISLHPEKQPDQESTELKKKPKAESRPRKAKNTAGAALTDDKTDDGMSYTDEESLTSDISLSSSVASAKKLSLPPTSMETATNEELLSDILVGLVSQKSTEQEDLKSGDRGSDGDADDNEASSTVVKKASTKKKKKRLNWQMGIILSKKKKKKSAPVSIPPENMDVDPDTESISGAPDVHAQETKVDENQVEDDKENSEQVPSVLTKEKEDNVRNETSVQEVAEPDNESTTPSPPATETPVPKGDVKKKDKQQSPRVDSIPPKQGSKKDKQSESKDESGKKNIDINQLISYAWTGQERYKCLLCFFNGKNIVHHYKLNHSNSEVLISRLNQSTATIATQEAKEADFAKICETPVDNKTVELSCRFCYFSTKGEMNDIIEAFYEHCTMHTGEYRFRCNSCPYQSVTKSSMKTHYYKVCRRFSDNCHDAIHEDEIPNEYGIYGYLCSVCNFVQLKRDNVEKHMENWHKNVDAEIIKICMSVMINEDCASLNDSKKASENSAQNSRLEKIAVKDQEQKCESPVIAAKEDDNTVAEKDKEKLDPNDDVPESSMVALKYNSSAKKLSEQEETNLEEEIAKSVEEAEGPQQNLSVFVCPPELENKDAEIELERKKKMQEIIENMKLRRDVHDKSSSIIDQLRNKMETVRTSNQASETELLTKSSEGALEDSVPQNNAPTSPDVATNVEFRITDVCSLGSDSLEVNPDPPVVSNEQNPDVSASTETLDHNSTDSKVKDPLTSNDDVSKKCDSDVDVSDNEIAPTENVPDYESDSSSEQSEAELPTDVNTILKETSNINPSSKDPMMTTIQRLAAQLQNAKPLQPLSSEMGDLPEVKIKVEETSPITTIPKAPDVIPIASIRRFSAKQDATINDQQLHATGDKTPSKNFIRLRRLSGDMLSAPVQTIDDDEDMPTTPPKTDAKPLDKMPDVLQTEAEEECSFLKIENVVSLASSADNSEVSSPVVNDIRKIVESSPVKAKAVSLLKRNSAPPLILKKLNALTIAQAMTNKVMQPTQANSADTIKIIPITNLTPTAPAVSANSVTTTYVPIMPKPAIPKIQVDPSKLIGIPISKDSVGQPITTRTISFTSATPTTNLNYKIVKVVKTPSIIKPKEIFTQPVGIKMKSKKAYTDMLDINKLSHLYKCMAQDCSFTTDTINLFCRHYYNHACLDRKYSSPPYDYQKCAYCYKAFDEWSQMKNHIDEKHAHCRYQCSNCFYRAITPYFVQLHQVSSHPGIRPNVLTGKYAKSLPLKDDINRRDFVLPFVCRHDCGQIFYVPEDFIAHLKLTHSGTKLTILKCHLCSNTFATPDLLIAHYRIHEICKYQCLYCLNGTNTFNEMHTHLSLAHCNRLPQFLERSFTRQIVKNKDIIDQLTIRNVGMYLKHVNPFATNNDIQDNKEGGDSKNGNADCTALVLAHNQIKTNVTLTVLKDKPKEVTKSLISDTIASASGQHSNDSAVIEPSVSTAEKEFADRAHGTKGTLVFPDSNASSFKVLLDSLVNQPSQLLVGQTATGCESLPGGKDVSKKPDPGSQHILQEPELALVSFTNEDTNARDPLGGSLALDDEFIDTNLLDNPEFFKNISKRSHFAGIGDTSSKSNEKADDSDIEILDSIVPDKNNENNKMENATKDQGEDESKNVPTEIVCQQKINEKEQPVMCSSTENSNTSFDLNTCEVSNNENGNVYNLLTLEDIKDTGFSGTMLYKCGYDDCTFSALNANLLRSHMKECGSGGANKYSHCTHCRKRFLKVGFLLEHLKVHGLKRFGCSLCKLRYVTGFQATSHMKTKHKFTSSKLVPADPKNPSADGLFVVQAIRGPGERKGKKRKGAKPTDKDSERRENVEKTSFSPDEIEQLPRQAIYNREVQCAVCPYTTKVRTNIVRHLQLHAKDETVPESGPVNPVPCLDKKERMFDKMVNLASSSHQNGRMGGKTKETTKENEDEFIPKFVPENKRYVCGVAECNYLTVDEAMLRYHLKALHSEEPYFKCPHCPQPAPGQEGQNIAIEKMGVHLKMHDTRLYKCSHCNHHHYHRHVVERHLSDKHPEKRPFVKVIRELEHADTIQPSPQEETDEEIPDPDGNHWKCNMCDYKCVYKAEMSTHVANVHDEKCQYKCTSCTFKTSGKILFEQHINSKHSTDPNADYLMVYQRIKGVNKKIAENVEQAQQDEPFDTTPIWRRDMPRVRHIRGILLEEEETRKTGDGPTKSNKRKSDADITPTRPAKIKPGKSASLDDGKPLQEKPKHSLSCEKIPDTQETSKPKASEPNVNEDSTSNDKTDVPTDLNDNNDSDIGQFGPYGKPMNNMFVCTLCNQYKVKHDHEMRDHLYKELNYVRWHCKECGYLTVNHNSLLHHCKKRHGAEKTAYQLLSPDNAIEEWVQALLTKQKSLMKESSKQQPSVITSTNAQAQSTENVTKKSNKSVDLTHAISVLKEDKSSDMNVSILSDDDDDELIIDMNDMPVVQSTMAQSPTKKAAADETVANVEEKPFACKHCNQKFPRWRGLKLHVQVSHLKRLGYLCPYCDRSSNSETLLRHHIQAKHPGCEERVIENVDSKGPELSSDFWEKEYGIILPKKTKKRKPKVNEDGQSNNEKQNRCQIEMQQVCGVCGFTAINRNGLKVHMRRHVCKNYLRCVYCTFSGSVKAELHEHWEANHPQLPFRIDDISLISPVKKTNTEQQRKLCVTDYINDIEEEPIIIDSGIEETLLYCCLYCNVRSRSLSTLKVHWNEMHNSPADAKNTPFKYKELKLTPAPLENIGKTVQCSVQGAESAIKAYKEHSQNSASSVDRSSVSRKEGWICQWCDEFCDTAIKKKAHHNLFHSHKQMNFKKQELQATPEEYMCPECSLITSSLAMMKEHVTKHINTFKCRICDKTFTDLNLVKAHHSTSHPGLEEKIDSIREQSGSIDKIMSKVMCVASNGQQKPVSEKRKSNISLKRPAMAKKSTTKSIIRVHPNPTKIQAVARKSTNPLPRYPPGINFATDLSDDDNEPEKTQSEQFSFYGIPEAPIDLGRLSTYMVVGGHRMRVNCATLSQLIDIKPRIVLHDVLKSKSSSSYKN